MVPTLKKADLDCRSAFPVFAGQLVYCPSN